MRVLFISGVINRSHLLFTLLIVATTVSTKVVMADVDSCAATSTDKCTDCAKPWCFLDAATGSGVCKPSDTQEIAGELERWEDTSLDVDQSECECNWNGQTKCSGCDKPYCFQEISGSTSKCISRESWLDQCNDGGDCDADKWHNLSYNYPDNCAEEGEMSCGGADCPGIKYPCCYSDKCYSFSKFYTMDHNIVMICHSDGGPYIQTEPPQP